MILLSDDVIMVVDFEGKKRRFELDDLQARVIKSLFSVGMRDPSVAEDLALSIEYVLAKNAENGSIFTYEEIDRIVLKVLEDTGMPDVAAVYRRQNRVRERNETFQRDAVRELIKFHLGLSSERLDMVVDEVENALRLSNVSAPSNHLIVEMARYFREKTRSINITATMFKKKGKYDIWVLKTDEIIANIPAADRFYTNADVIYPHNVSRLFPAIKIDVNLDAFAEKHELQAPLTELAVFPLLLPLAKELDKILTVIRHNLPSEFDQIPAYLRLARTQNFTKKFLDGELSQSTAFCHEISSCLENFMNQELYQINMI